MVRSYLTNEWIEPEVAEKRPVAVMIPNEASAIPHYNLSEASVLYEANVEGRMTRMMAIFEDWESLNKIGNVRSLRNYYAYWAFEWDAYIVHIGGPFFINDLIDEETTDSIDENDWEGNLAFFRTGDRSTPHNAYVSGSGLAKAINKYGYSQTDRGLRDSYHYNFAGKAVPNTLQQYGENAMDAVLADVPCSGLGVIRKKPDIRYKNLAQTERLPEIQLAILRQQAHYVKPGGVLVYSTCTILKRENENVVQAFLRDDPQFSAETVHFPQNSGIPDGAMTTLLPCTHGTDGFFICKLRRKP